MYAWDADARAGVRLVAHLNLPKTLEGFYQESGRAGRDGQPSQSVLFYDEADRERMDWILSAPPTHPPWPSPQIEQVLDACYLGIIANPAQKQLLAT